MRKGTYETNKGTIVYWLNEHREGRANLVFLPGLTADHRLFDKQIEYFEDKANVFVWDAPGHNESKPFTLDFALKDKAIWLHEILEKEHIENPILVGQSMGGYVSQVFLELYPDVPAGFVSIDSSPLQKKYMTGFEIWMLKHCEGMYRLYPWKSLLKAGAKGCAETEYGVRLMYEMMAGYTHEEYSKLAGHGYGMVAEAVEANLPYKITCPAILVCGEEDKAGSAKNYNKRWTEKTGLLLFWIEGAGHNSNTDKPEEINTIIEEMMKIVCE